jgi:hypothetical protein
MLGYLQKEDRVFLMDNARNVVSFRVLLSVLQFQTAVVRGDMAAANALVPALPEAEHSTVARFLESQGLKDEALSLTKDPDQKFDLALELGRLEVATQLLAEVVGGRGRGVCVLLPDTQLLWEIEREREKEAAWLRYFVRRSHAGMSLFDLACVLRPNRSRKRTRTRPTR